MDDNNKEKDNRNVPDIPVTEKQPVTGLCVDVCALLQAHGCSVTDNDGDKKLQNTCALSQSKVKDCKVNQEMSQKKSDQISSLYSSEDFQRIALQSLDGFMIMLSTDGVIIFVTENISSLLGYSPDEIMGEELLTLLPKKERREVYGKIVLRLPVSSIVGKHSEFCCHLRRGQVKCGDSPTYEYVKFIMSVKDLAEEPLKFLKMYFPQKSYDVLLSTYLPLEDRFYMVGTVCILRAQILQELSSIKETNEDVIVIQDSDEECPSTDYRSVQCQTSFGIHCWYAESPAAAPDDEAEMVEFQEYGSQKSLSLITLDSDTSSATSLSDLRTPGTPPLQRFGFNFKAYSMHNMVEVKDVDEEERDEEEEKAELKEEDTEEEEEEDEVFEVKKEDEGEDEYEVDQVEDVDELDEKEEEDEEEDEDEVDQVEEVDEVDEREEEDEEEDEDEVDQVEEVDEVDEREEEDEEEDEYEVDQVEDVDELDEKEEEDEEEDEDEVDQVEEVDEVDEREEEDEEEDEDEVDQVEEVDEVDEREEEDEEDDEHEMDQMDEIEEVNHESPSSSNLSDDIGTELSQIPLPFRAYIKKRERKLTNMFRVQLEEKIQMFQADLKIQQDAMDVMKEQLKMLQNSKLQMLVSSLQQTDNPESWSLEPVLKKRRAETVNMKTLIPDLTVTKYFYRPCSPDTSESQEELEKSCNASTQVLAPEAGAQVPSGPQAFQEPAEYSSEKVNYFFSVKQPNLNEKLQKQLLEAKPLEKRGNRPMKPV